MFVSLRFPRWISGPRPHWLRHLGNSALVVVVLAGVQLWQTRHVPPSPAPDLALVVLERDGRLSTITLSEWRARHPGRPVALHFWAEWCPICRTEEAGITRLQRDWPVLTVAMQSGDADAVARVLQRRGLSWDAVIDPAAQVSRAHGMSAVPGFLVVDRQGKVRTPTVGYTTEWGMRLRLWWVDVTD